MTYHGALCEAMKWLGEQQETIFIGQGVGNPGTAMSDTLLHVPMSKRIEFPVAEEMQVGMCIGMSLRGYIPICVIPRWNFALRAADQIINHLDRLPLYSAYRPKVVIRVATPSSRPFNPGQQHDADFTDAFRLMARDLQFYTLKREEDVLPFYRRAFKTGGIVVEYTDLYRNARAVG